MFLVMDDTSGIADWGRELGDSNKRFIEINDMCLCYMVSDNFLEVFKQILNQNKYSNIQERKCRPKIGKELSLNRMLFLPFNENEIHTKFEESYALLNDYKQDQDFFMEDFIEEEKYQLVRDIHQELKENGYV